MQEKCPKEFSLNSLLPLYTVVSGCLLYIPSLSMQRLGIMKEKSAIYKAGWTPSKSSLSSSWLSQTESSNNINTNQPINHSSIFKQITLLHTLNLGHISSFYILNMSTLSVPIYVALTDGDGVFNHWALFVDAPLDSEKTIYHAMGSQNRFRYNTRPDNPRVSPDLIEMVWMADVQVDATETETETETETDTISLSIFAPPLTLTSTSTSTSTASNTSSTKHKNKKPKLDHNNPQAQTGPSIQHLLAEINQVAEKVTIRNDLDWWNCQDFIMDLLRDLEKVKIIDRRAEHYKDRKHTLTRKMDGLVSLEEGKGVEGEVVEVVG